MNGLRVGLFLLMGLLLAGAAAVTPASGAGQHSGKGQEKAQRAVEKGESKAQRALDKGDAKAERALEKEESKEMRDPGTDVGRGEAARKPEGFMGRMRRFFGWERSQERMSEQGREHERATEQDRGPKDSPAPEND